MITEQPHFSCTTIHDCLFHIHDHLTAHEYLEVVAGVRQRWSRWCFGPSVPQKGRKQWPGTLIAIYWWVKNKGKNGWSQQLRFFWMDTRSSWKDLLRKNNSCMIWRWTMPITDSRSNTSTTEVLVLLPKASSNGTTLFTGEQLYLTGNDFILLLQQLYLSSTQSVHQE